MFPEAKIRKLIFYVSFEFRVAVFVTLFCPVYWDFDVKVQ